LNTDVHHNVR